MLKKLLALAVLALALSPFTAPFRTCDPSQISSVVLIDENESGSLVAPLVTECGRLKIATTVGTLIVAPLIAQPPDTFITQSIARMNGSGERSIAPTVLRV
jgi:hypothetical protein